MLKRTSAFNPPDWVGGGVGCEVGVGVGVGEGTDIATFITFGSSCAFGASTSGLLVASMGDMTNSVRGVEEGVVFKKSPGVLITWMLARRLAPVFVLFKKLRPLKALSA